MRKQHALNTDKEEAAAAIDTKIADVEASVRLAAAARGKAFPRDALRDAAQREATLAELRSSMQAAAAAEQYGEVRARAGGVSRGGEEP